MSALNIARATLIGNSLGGAIALNYALHHSDRVDKLVLVDSALLGRACHPMLRLVTLPIEDGVVPVSQAQVAKDKIPNAEILIFEQCGHTPQMECPDKFNAAVLEFLAE